MSLNRTNPPYRADHVGSFLRPARLLAAREKAGLIGTQKSTDAVEGAATAALRDVEADCIRELIKLQEDVGLRVVTDGELRRGSWHNDTISKINGLVLRPGPEEAKFKGQDRRPLISHVEGKVSRKAGGLVVNEYRYTKTLTDRTVKVTMVAPVNVYRPERGGYGIVSKDAYPDIEEFYEDLTGIYRDEIKDLAEAGCTYVQLDNTGTAGLCDPRFRELSRTLGVDPDRQLSVQGKLVSAATRDRPANMAISMHICRGNAAGTWIFEGGYDPVAETLFNEFDVDAFFLEYDSERAGDFTPLRFVPKSKTVVLGLVTTKTPENDDGDVLKRRIDEAAKYIPMENLCLSPQCGFSSGAGLRPITLDDQKRKLELVVKTAEQIWGNH